MQGFTINPRKPSSRYPSLSECLEFAQCEAKRSQHRIIVVFQSAAMDHHI